MTVVDSRTLPLTAASAMRSRFGMLAIAMIGLCLACTSVFAKSRQIDEYHWVKVERIVAIGDLHGDYENYLRVLQAAGVADARGRWIAGETHLVQLGDIPDRGPNTLKIIAHLQKLAAQAKRRGGQVHTLLGNHEAMNTYGDLRYVSDGEFKAFVVRNSAELRDRYHENVLADIKTREPERFASLPDDFREAWNASHPLGWVEHQRGWNPRWNPQGTYFTWAMQDKVAIQINDLIFLHGGLSADYCMNSLASLTDKAREALRRSDPATPSILTDQRGPLWYRGLAGVEPFAATETVAAILERHAARHIVIGHTPTQGAVWPNYSGRVIQIDTGISATYGGHVAYLEVTTKGLMAGYANGKVALPQDDVGRGDYLDHVIVLQPDNTALKRQRAAFADTTGKSATDGAAAGYSTSAVNLSANELESASAAICGISP